jgi:hypothetical protein
MRKTGASLSEVKVRDRSDQNSKSNKVDGSGAIALHFCTFTLSFGRTGE